MKRLTHPRVSFLRVLSWALLVAASLGRAQTSFLLQLNSLQVTPGHPVQFTFTDAGTGATNYMVEFSTAVGGTDPWTNVTEALITSLGEGSFQVLVPDPQIPMGFYRVRGLGGSEGAVTASFNATALQVAEGGLVSPVITFSAPYAGVVRYTISGTAASGDYVALSGEVMVDGTTAAIPVSVTDNEVIGQLKYLILTLETGPGLRLGAGSQTIITIEENDAHWQGSFIADNAALGFGLSIWEVYGGYQASLRSSEFGFFPTNDIPAAISLTDDAFEAAVANVLLPAASTLLSEPLNLSLFLSASNGQPNQLVSSTQLEGSALMIAEVWNHPHLNTTNMGRFLLFKPPSQPSTNDVELVTIP